MGTWINNFYESELNQITLKRTIPLNCKIVFILKVNQVHSEASNHLILLSKWSELLYKSLNGRSKNIS